MVLLKKHNCKYIKKENRSYNFNLSCLHEIVSIVFEEGHVPGARGPHSWLWNVIPAIFGHFHYGLALLLVLPLFPGGYESFAQTQFANFKI